MKTKYDILIDKRVKHLEGDIECLDKICKSLKRKDVDIEIELIRNVQASIMFIIDNLKLEKRLNNEKKRLIILNNPKSPMNKLYKQFNEFLAEKAKK